MTAKAYAQVRGVVSAYDFSRFALVQTPVAAMHLLQGILKNAPSVRGVLFDLPHVIEQARVEASDRLKLLGGDFFTDQLPACDAYLLMDTTGTTSVRSPSSRTCGVPLGLTRSC